MRAEILSDKRGEKMPNSDDKKMQWREHGVRVIPANSLDSNTAQTPGMSRAAAVNFARVGAEKIWAGTVTIHPNAKTGAHHHGPVESVIYVDFIYVPPYVPHQEINANENEALECVLLRSGQEPVVVNLDIPAVENPEAVYWVDNIHPHP
jgi:uncharacterized RmlC-like cupin family protein